MNEHFNWGWITGAVSFIKEFWIGLGPGALVTIVAGWYKLTDRRRLWQREDQERAEKRAEKDRAEKEAWIAAIIKDRDRAHADAEAAEARARAADEARHLAVVQLHQCRAEYRAEVSHLRFLFNDLERRNGLEVTKWSPINPP